MAKVDGTNVNNNAIFASAQLGFVPAIVSSIVQFTYQFLLLVYFGEIELFWVKLLTYTGHILRWPPIGGSIWLELNKKSKFSWQNLLPDRINTVSTRIIKSVPNVRLFFVFRRYRPEVS